MIYTNHNNKYNIKNVRINTYINNTLLIIIKCN